MAEDRFKNQRGLLDADRLGRTRFVVIGAGAIGSFVVASLSKMGARDITVYDFDNLEDHNFANQMYPISQLGRPKVEALKAVSLDYGDCAIKAENRAWTDGSPETDIVISAVDNMDVRARIFAYYKSRCSFYIDGRMSSLVCRVFGVQTNSEEQIRHYESTLYPQSEATPERCGEKSIIFTVLSVASQICQQVFLYLNNEYRPTDVNVDMFNNTVEKVYHMTLEPAVFEEEPIKEEVHAESTEVDPT